MSELPAALAVRLAELAAAERPVVLIDGGAGSGKTTLAGLLRAAWPGHPPELVGMDEFYPGWDGLASAAAQVPGLIVAAGFTCWDWTQHRPGAWRELDPSRALIIEGCGALTPASRAAATFGIWLDLPEGVRRERALARDGAMFAPHWERWAAQEAAHWQRHQPDQLADLVLDAAELA